MESPSYKWSCLNCGAANAPDQEVCIECGITAVASAKDIESARGKHTCSQASALRRLWDGKFGLRQSFWNWWLAPILGFYLVLWLSWFQVLQHLGIAAIPIAMFCSVLLAAFATTGVVKGARRSLQERPVKHVLSALSVLGTLIHFLAFCFVVFLSTAFYSAGFDVHEENREAEQAAVPTAEFPLAGFWKVESDDEFGLAISPAGEAGYSVSFCGPGGCFKPGTYRPDTPIFGDGSYSVIDDNTLKVQGKDGWTTYRRATSRREAIVSGNQSQTLINRRSTSVGQNDAGPPCPGSLPLNVI